MGANATAVWKTRDGKSIPLDEMTDDHLANAIAFLARQEKNMEAGAWSAACYASSTGGEMAADAANKAADQMMDAASDARQWRLLMQDEVKRRATKKPRAKK